MSYLRRRGRPLAAVGAATLVMVALVLPTGAAKAAGTPFVPGSAAASAGVAKVKLFYAGYSLQVPLGTSAATYENRQSRALGGAYDLSSATGLLKVKVPQVAPISTDSNAGDSTKVADVGAGPLLGRVELSAKAVPASAADVRLADVDLPGLMRVQGGRTHAETEVVAGRVRRAEADATVASVSLLGGLVVLDGLHWTATQQSGATSTATGAFTLGALRVAGSPVATDLHSIDPVLAQVNAVLAPTGLVLAGPLLVHHDDGSLEITAMRLGILNSPVGASALAPVIAGVRPLLVPLFAALSSANDTLGLTALVADLGLGVADGSGGAELAIGGAIARTDATTYADPLAGRPSGSIAAGSRGIAAPASPVAGGLPAIAPPLGGPGAPSIEAAIPTSATGPARCVLAASPQRKGACRGTNLPGAIAVVAVAVSGWGTYEAALRRRPMRSSSALAGAS